MPSAFKEPTLSEGERTHMTPSCSLHSVTVLCKEQHRLIKYASVEPDNPAKDGTWMFALEG